MSFPLGACVVGSLSLLPQLGLSKKKKILEDLESCGQLDARSGAEQRQYCWHRGKLAADSPIMIRINQGGHIFKHKLAKYRYESHKVTRTLTAFEDDIAVVAGNIQRAPQSERLQLWRTDEIKTQTSPVAYAPSISVDGKYSIDDMRDKLPTHKLQTVFSESAELRSGDSEAKAGGKVTNVSVNLLSAGGREFSGDAFGEGQTVDVGYKHRVHGIREGDTVTVVGDMVANAFSGGAHFNTIDERPFEKIVADTQNYIWWAQAITAFGLATATGIGFAEVKLRSNL